MNSKSALCDGTWRRRSSVSGSERFTIRWGPSGDRRRARIRRPDPQRWASAGSRRTGWSRSCPLRSGYPGTTTHRDPHVKAHITLNHFFKIIHHVQLIWGWTQRRYAATGESEPFVPVFGPSIMTVINTLRSISVKTRRKARWMEMTLP